MQGTRGGTPGNLTSYTFQNGSLDKYYSFGVHTKLVSGSATRWLIGNKYHQQDGSETDLITNNSSSWTFQQGVYQWDGVGYDWGSRINYSHGWGSNLEILFDDNFLVELDDVTLTVTAAVEAESLESNGLRVDGRDTLTQTIDTITSSSGDIRWAYTPRHSAAVALDCWKDKTTDCDIARVLCKYDEVVGVEL